MTWLIFLTILLGAPLTVLFLPPRWVPAAIGWWILLIGLVWIENRTSTPAPYDDDGIGLGLGGALALIWGAALAMAATARLKSIVSDPRHAPLFLAWPVPIAILVAVAVHHWLSNRLAGMTPAFLVHLALVAAAAAILLEAIRLRGRVGRLRLLFVSAFALAMVVLVHRDAWLGFRLWQESVWKAAGRPHCVMTYGGFEHRRPARSGWDMSPLVNRLYGNWAAGKAPILIVSNMDGAMVGYRRTIGGWQEVGIQRESCRPLRPPVSSPAGPRSR